MPAPKKSMRPKARPDDMEERMAVERGNRMNEMEAKEGEALVKKAKGGKMIKEYGGKEMYKSKAAMKRHEAKESPAMERKEKKMAGGGMCRGMGAATKGGKFRMG